MTKLINAVLDNDINLVKECLRSHADVDVNAQDQNQNTALHIAVVSKGFDDIVCELLKHPDIDVNSKDYENKTPLHYAYQHGMKKTTDMLLKHRNINCFSEDNQGKRPFDYFQPKSSHRHDFFKAPAPVQPVKKNLDSPSLCAKAVNCLFGRFI